MTSVKNLEIFLNNRLSDMKAIVTGNFPDDFRIEIDKELDVQKKELMESWVKQWFVENGFNIGEE